LESEGTEKGECKENVDDEINKYMLLNCIAKKMEERTSRRTINEEVGCKKLIVDSS